MNRRYWAVTTISKVNKYAEECKLDDETTDMGCRCAFIPRITWTFIKTTDTSLLAKAAHKHFNRFVNMYYYTISTTTHMFL